MFVTAQSSDMEWRFPLLPFLSLVTLLIVVSTSPNQIDRRIATEVSASQYELRFLPDGLAMPEQEAFRYALELMIDNMVDQDGFCDSLRHNGWVGSVSGSLACTMVFKDTQGVLRFGGLDRRIAQNYIKAVRYLWVFGEEGKVPWQYSSSLGVRR